MSRSIIRRRSFAVTAALGLFSFAAVTALVARPAQSFDAARAALQFWWNIVFPAMLPYLILVRIASVYGVHAFAGRLLAPLVRLLRLPAGSGPVLSAGLLHGGAEGPCRAARLLARTDPEGAARLAAASAPANPALVVTVLAVSLLESPGTAPLLLAVHYGSWLAAALALSAIRRKSPAEAAAPDLGTTGFPEESRRPPFGRTLGDAVTDTLQRLLELGGVIIVFAVAVRQLSLLGLPRLAGAAGFPLDGFWATALAAGFFELHNGLLALAGAAASKAAFCLMSALLAWGGLALQLDVRARLRKAGVRYAPSLRFRLVHAALAAAGAWLLWPAVGPRLRERPDEQAADSAFLPIPWAEAHGVPGEALCAAALAVLLLIRRLAASGRGKGGIRRVR